MTPSQPRAESSRLAMGLWKPDVLVLYISRSIPDQETQTWTYDVASAQWTKRDPAVDPGPRRDFAMSHVQQGMVLLTGGGENDHVWVYRGDTTWEDVTACYEQVPPARSQHAMAYLGDGQVLLQGGRGPGGELLGDTWLLTSGGSSEGKCPGEEWQEITEEAGGEILLRQHDMAYAGSDRVVMFGGLDEMTERSDSTWIFENGQWSEVVPADGVRPPARSSHSLAFHASGSVVLFGGQDASNDPLGDTWRFLTNPRIWFQDEARIEPAARYEAAMEAGALDPCAPVRVVLVDGTTGVSTLQDTWIYDGLGPSEYCP